MGNNLDLVQMLGVSSRVKCPKCEDEVRSYTNDYDVECGNPNPEKGIWILDYYCPNCKHEWEYKFRIKLEVIDA